jgi:hypothetical protein
MKRLKAHYRRRQKQMGCLLAFIAGDKQMVSN